MRLIDLTGQRFGQWVVIGRTKPVEKTSHTTFWTCLCDCGLTKEVGAESLRSGRSSCPCVARRNMIGRQFYQWTVLDGPFKPSYGSNLDWLCKCECGRELRVKGTNLLHGGSKGCGCSNIKKFVSLTKTHGLCRTIEYAIYVGAKSRARKDGLDFNLELSDIYVPKLCPVLGIPMFKATGRNKSNSPSLDRIVASLGYVKGNIWVISNRANTIKNDATVEELELVAKAVRQKTEEIIEQALYQLAG